MKLFLSQIQDIDKMPYYLNRLGELNIEDNNVVLNYQLSGNTSNKGIGGGITIQDGDALGNDVTFRIASLNTLSDGDLNISEYTNGSGYTNLGFVTEVNDIVLGNTSTTSMDGVRVIKEKDVINGGVIGSGSPYSGSTRELTYLNKVLWGAGDIPSVEDLLPGQLAINVPDGKVYTLKLTDGVYEVISLYNTSESVSNSATTQAASTVTTQNLTWASPSGTSNEERYPAYGLYDYSHSMFIIRADEIGSGEKLINALEIEVDGYSQGYTYYNQTIKLAHTSDLEFASNVNANLNGIGGLNNLTEVKVNFDWSINSPGFQTITFDTPFDYNGTDNLIIIWENRDGNWGSGFGWAECHFDNTYYESWYKHQDNAYPSGPGTRDKSYRPNFKLKY